MPPERKYSETEVAYILEQATTAREVSPAFAPSNEGLSLAQIRDIATEVGIDPAKVEQAALSIDRGEGMPAFRRTWLGLPIGVSRTVEFGRTLTEAEWDQLVVLFRETFDARGRLQAEGSFRQWTNGNLQALLEPTPNGHRLRLSTRKGDAKARLILGVAGLTFGGVWLTGILTSGAQDVGALVAMGVLATWSICNVASVSLGLPAWARKRAEQMDLIAEQVRG
jgi:hypothetical protein